MTATKPLTRQQLDRFTSFAHADDMERALLYATLDHVELIERSIGALHKELDHVRNECEGCRLQLEGTRALAAEAEKAHAAELETARGDVEEHRATAALYEAMAKKAHDERDQFAGACDVFKLRVLELEAKVAELSQLTLDQAHFNGRLVKECDAAEARAATLETALREAKVHS